MKNNKPREVYYDIQMTNLMSTGTTYETLRFSESRQNPLIDNTGDYSLSIVRFELDTYALPTFIADIVPNQSNANKMIETITMQWKNSRQGPLNLTWTPYNNSVTPPTTAIPTVDYSTDYYWGNNFRHYCDLVNNTFDSLTASLKTAVGAELNNLLPPKLVWDENTQKAVLYTQDAFYNSKLTDHVLIYFNRSLYAKFTSFPATKRLTSLFNKHYEIQVNDDYTSRNVTLPVSVGGVTQQSFIKTPQEYSTISNWNAVSSIVFTSNTLPIVATQTSDPLVFIDNVSAPRGTALTSAQVISDMATNDMCYKPNLMYVPSAEYRFIDMYGAGELHNIDINVFWKDKKGVLRPFNMGSGATASIKILFKLKE
jgi:hypothetical protein